MTGLSLPVRLERGHVREGFSSGADELDEWLAKYAWQNQRANNAVTFVTTLRGRVVGYYSLSVAGVAKEDAPGHVGKRAPQQVPCLLLARLAVDESVQGRRVGSGLLADALRRAARLSADIGMRALLVHARDAEAKAFYLSRADFLPFPGDPLKLMLPMEWILAKVKDKDIETT